ncbi:MAG: AMP-binding protein, partial [Thermoanaerobaculia bacterium]|nr:AMP-binding protein [Thermoanaerobaculia bacterium]
MSKDGTIELDATQQAAIEKLAKDEVVIKPPIWLAREAYLPNDEIDRAYALSNPDEFWAERAKGIDWIEPFRTVCEFEAPTHSWFAGGKLNATYNCLDRHVYSDRRNKAALLWVGENGDEHAYTYNRLYREVNRFANALRRLGVVKGDRIIIYMPLVPEGIITMLACARIGAIHSVVFAGMGTAALQARIIDSHAKVIVCSDFTFRRGKKISLKPTIDEAVRELDFVEHVVVHRRGSRPGDDPYEFESEREHDFYDIQQAR